jgi:sphingosine kinase
MSAERYELAAALSARVVVVDGDRQHPATLEWCPALGRLNLFDGAVGPASAERKQAHRCCVAIEEMLDVAFARFAEPVVPPAASAGCCACCGPTYDALPGDWAAELTVTHLPAGKDAAKIRELRLAVPAVAGAEEDVANIATVAAVYREALARIYPHGQLNFVAFVSPVSGSGDAVKNWARYGEAVLRRTRHTFTTITTTHRGHAQQYAAEETLHANDVVVAVGGDGMAFEVVNGMQKRRTLPPNVTAVETAVPSGGDVAPQLATFDLDGAVPRIATFPCGSGCALATSLGVLDFSAAAMALVHCRGETVDLMLITTTPPAPDAADEAATEPVAPEGVATGDDPLYGFLSLNFGFGGDIDIKSESKRWMGNARFTVQALQMLCGAMPKYPVDIRYKPVRAAATGAVLDRFEAIDAAGLTPFALDREADGPTAASEIVFDADAEWVTLPQEEFVFLAVLNIPRMAQDMIAAPFARPADGCLDIIYSTSTVSRTRLLLAMVGMEDGTHFPHEDLKYIKCAAVEVAPKKGPTSVDGELVPCATIRSEMAANKLRFVKQAIPAALPPKATL